MFVGWEEEMVKCLVRVGYDNLIGYLKGGFEVWVVEGREIDCIEIIDVFIFV